ncbi:MAG: diacylglycerol kinase family protein [Candidatus Omnitrophica bacterium]|nr:diacylglycerol kinase family protein [Candidatus Omnitrophota bacterium]
MTKKSKLTPRGLYQSFAYAFNGIRITLFSQQHAWFYLAVTILIFAAGVILRISPGKWCWMIIAVVTVWTAEALNTAFEFLCDVASPEFHPLVEKAKDVSAGAVLICIIGASAIGLLILGPPLLIFLGFLP